MKKNKIRIGEIFAGLLFDFLGIVSIISMINYGFSFQGMFFTGIFLLFGIAQTIYIIGEIKKNIDYKRK